MAGPRDAEITIVGGGALGAAVAYFLARDGRADVQLLEARGLCEATSSQAAGFVGQARPTVERARLIGLELPIVPVLHEYFVTEPVPGWHAGLPC